MLWAMIFPFSKTCVKNSARIIPIWPISRLPAARLRKKSPEYEEMKRKRYFWNPQQLRDIAAKKNAKPVNSAVQKYLKQEKK